MNFKRNINFFLLFFFTITILAHSQSVAIPDKPQKETSFYDFGTHVLTASQQQAIEQKLIHYADSTSTQIVVILVPTTGGEQIARFATDIGHKWGVGQKNMDNGIILLAAVDDRNVTIQTGYGVEHLLTDALARRIIEREIVPEFRKQNYYAGIDNATTVIFQVLKGEYQSTGSNNENSVFPVILIIVGVIVFLSIISKTGGGKGNRNHRSPDLMDIIILSSLGRGGGGFGSGRSFGSGGGFGGGFGGGGFGGGGASGSW